MRTPLFSVLDDKLGKFNSPMAFPSQGLAHRTFTDEVNREAADNPMHRYPGDFSLWKVGEFDPDTGCFVSTDTGIPVLVCRASEVKF